MATKLLIFAVLVILTNFYFIGQLPFKDGKRVKRHQHELSLSEKKNQTQVGISFYEDFKKMQQEIKNTTLKTPVEALQILLLRQKQGRAIYNITTDTEGGGYKCVVSVDDHKVEGKGDNKKDAKQAGAIKMINVLAGVTIGPNELFYGAAMSTDDRKSSSSNVSMTQSSYKSKPGIDSIPKITSDISFLEAFVQLQEEVDKKNSTMKTPVEVLQILLKRQNKEPAVYNITSNTEGNGYKCLVSADGRKVEGEGDNKKKAKQAGAIKMINVLAGVFVPNEYYRLENSSPSALNSTGSKMSISSTNLSTNNYIGLLQEFAQKGRLSIPTFELESEAGSEHGRIFTIVCTFKNHTARGSGKSKKIAKQQAALEMWKQVQDSNSS